MAVWIALGLSIVGLLVALNAIGQIVNIQKSAKFAQMVNIVRLDLKPGDILLIQTEHAVHQEAVARTLDTLNRAFKRAGVPKPTIVMCQKGFEFKALNRDL